MEQIKKWWLAGLLAVTVLVGMIPAVATAAGAPRTLFIGVNPVGSLYHTAGTALADVASQYSGIDVRIRPMTGPHVWVSEMIKQGSPQLGLIDAYDAWMAYNGKITPLSPPPPDIKHQGPLRYERNDTIRALRVAFILIVDGQVRAASGIKTHDQLRGKRIPWQFAGWSPGVTMVRTMLAYGGLTPDDVTLVPVADLPGNVHALIENRVDLTSIGVGAAISSEAHARIPGGIYALPAPKDPKRREAGRAVYPGLYIDTFPGGILDGIPEKNEFSMVPAMVVTSTKIMDDETAYALIKAWWEHDKELAPKFRLFRGTPPQKYVRLTTTVPYHPGAIRWYKEKGVWTDKMERVQKRLLNGEYPFLD